MDDYILKKPLKNLVQDNISLYVQHHIMQKVAETLHQSFSLNQKNANLPFVHLNIDNILVAYHMYEPDIFLVSSSNNNQNYSMYRAPEVGQLLQQCTIEATIYSLGIIAIELFVCSGFKFTSNNNLALLLNKFNVCNAKNPCLKL